MKAEKNAAIDVQLYGSPEGWAKLDLDLGDLLTGETVVRAVLEWDVSKVHSREAVRLVRQHLQEAARHLGGYEVMERAVTSDGGLLN